MRSYNPPAGVLVAGIALPVFDDASDTRTVRIQMQPLTAGNQRATNPLLDLSNRDAVEELGAKIRRMLIGRWDIFLAAQKAVREMLIGFGHEARAADLFSPLVAGYVALTSGELPSRELLAALLEECQLTTVVVKDVQRDGEVCLALLLNRRVAIFESVDGKPVKSHERIRDVVKRIIGSGSDTETRQGLIRQVEKFGLRPLWRRADNEWKLVVATSEMNSGMRRLMQGTPWSQAAGKTCSRVCLVPLWASSAWTVCLRKWWSCAFRQTSFHPILKVIMSCRQAHSRAATHDAVSQKRA